MPIIPPRWAAAAPGWVVRTNPFEGGSDHTPFIDARKPGLLLWHFTDQFYHTDGDRIDMVSADELRNVGMSALVSAVVLTALVHGDRDITRTGARSFVVAGKPRSLKVAGPTPLTFWMSSIAPNGPLALR